MDAMKCITTLPVSFAMHPSRGLSGYNPKTLPNIGNVTTWLAERSRAVSGLTKCSALPSPNLLSSLSMLHQENDSHPPAGATEIVPDAPGSASLDIIEACQARSLTFTCPKAFSLSQLRPGGEGFSQGEAHIRSLNHPQRP